MLKDINDASSKMQIADIKHVSIYKDIQNDLPRYMCESSNANPQIIDVEVIEVML